MERVEFTEMIITCEACGSVTRFTLKNPQDADQIFQQFQCENGCGRNLYSFITLGTLKMNSSPSEENHKKTSGRKAAPAKKKTTDSK